MEENEEEEKQKKRRKEKEMGEDPDSGNRISCEKMYKEVVK